MILLIIQIISALVLMVLCYILGFKNGYKDAENVAVDVTVMLLDQKDAFWMKKLKLKEEKEDAANRERD